MKKYSIILIFMIYFTLKLFSDTNKDYLFDMDTVSEIKIDISSSEWAKLLANFDKNPENEENVKADFTFIKKCKKETLKNIGFRIR